MTRATTSRFLVALLALTALLGSACAETADPEERLSSAVEDTFDGGFDYRFTIEADRDALTQLGDGAQQAALFLTGFGVEGTRDEDRFTFGVDAIGTRVLELRRIGDEATYINLGLQDVLGLLGAGDFDPRDEIVPALDQLGVSDTVKTAVIDLLDGKWIGVEGAFDAERFAELLGDAGATPSPSASEEAQRALTDAFGGDVPGFFDTFVNVVSVESGEDADRFEITVDAAALGQAISDVGNQVDQQAADELGSLQDGADLPDRVPGLVVVRDGKVTEIRIDVAGAAGATTSSSAGETTTDGATTEATTTERTTTTTTTSGAIDLRVEFSDFDEVTPVTAPDGATVLTSDDFADALERLLNFAGGLPSAP